MSYEDGGGSNCSLVGLLKPKQGEEKGFLIRATQSQNIFGPFPWASFSCIDAVTVSDTV